MPDKTCAACKWGNHGDRAENVHLSEWQPREQERSCATCSHLQYHPHALWPTGGCGPKPPDPLTPDEKKIASAWHAAIRESLLFGSSTGYADWLLREGNRKEAKAVTSATWIVEVVRVTRDATGKASVEYILPPQFLTGPQTEEGASRTALLLAAAKGDVSGDDVEVHVRRPF